MLPRREGLRIEPARGSFRRSTPSVSFFVFFIVVLAWALAGIETALLRRRRLRRRMVRLASAIARLERRAPIAPIICETEPPFGDTEPEARSLPAQAWTGAESSWRCRRPDTGTP